MSVILILIPLSLLVAALFLGAFIWAVRGGQFEDTCTPSMRVLADDGTVNTQKSDEFENQHGKSR
jgi:cbb3-type cytochrome oxidase maturation protein